MTLSIAARCPESGMVGVAIASSSICVASRCANVRSGVGAALSQNVTNPVLGRRALELMREGLSAAQVVDHLREQDPAIAWRQLVVVPQEGSPAIFSGARMLGVAATAVGEHCAAAGNLLADPALPDAMVKAFAKSRGALPDRLLAALRAGVAAGGEAGTLHAAGLLVADRQEWPVVDLRVDWSEGDPVAELAGLWERYQPQMVAYVTRALSPEEAPSYGVPGDP
jgi:uncharacterized Ntn-hydrolase superfamily protein